MKVLVITGSYPPDKCGVGDYAYHLSEALSKIPGVQVGVLTSASGRVPFDSSLVSVLRVMPSWRYTNVFRFRDVVSEFKPDLVHIQYPTQGYRGRLSKILPVLVKMMGIPVVQTWHEHYLECGQLGWANVIACDALVYVRPDFLTKLPPWVTRRLSNIPAKYIPNAPTIPVVSLSIEQMRNVKNDLSGGKPIVCYFGFAHPNKGVEHLFEIVDPEKFHLVLICDLDERNPYQAGISRLANQAAWLGRVTVTGFQSAERVGEIFAVADAAVFPFPAGAGEWNSSLRAAESSGLFTIATTQDDSLLGYREARNVYFAGCSQLTEMKAALNQHAGTRISTAVTVEPWSVIAMQHMQLYNMLAVQK